MGFEYKLVHKDRLAVLSFKGELDANVGPLLQKCLEEVVMLSPSGTVVDIEGVTSFPKPAFRDFFLFFKELKTNCKNIKMTGLAAETKADLIQRGLLSNSETSDTLGDAIKFLTPISSK